MMFGYPNEAYIMSDRFLDQLGDSRFIKAGSDIYEGCPKAAPIKSELVESTRSFPLPPFALPRFRCNFSRYFIPIFQIFSLLFYFCFHSVLAMVYRLAGTRGGFRSPIFGRLALSYPSFVSCGENSGLTMFAPSYSLPLPKHVKPPLSTSLSRRSAFSSFG